ncbi:MAG: amino acid permease [Sedimentisphaerales bacterium]|nr:amino acid permease [Sedimentisphaerales bacterium]
MNAQPKRQLTLFDSSCIIVGIIIGAGIYQMAPDIAKGSHQIGLWLNENFPGLGQEVNHWIGVLLLWLAGGLISLCGALGYAELATAWPKEGGDYVFLSKAYGKWAGFLFGWIQLTIVRPGDIAVMAFAFATYSAAAINPFGQSEQGIAIAHRVYAGAAVLILTLINILGVRQGKWAQNLLTTIKALGLVFVFLVAMSGPKGAAGSAEVQPLPVSLALVFVLFTYGGWNEMAYVAAEVKNPRKNITRALVLGTAAVTVLYLLVNGAFLVALGYEPMANSQAVATDAVAQSLPRIGAGLISLLVCISALGAVNGLIFTGARITYAMGAEHRLFSALGRWHEKTETPLPALLIQGVIALSMILIFGDFVKTLLYTAAAVYLFYLGTTIAVVVLRIKEPQAERPYRVTLFPLPLLIFAAVCLYLIYSCFTYAWSFQRLALFVLAGTVLAGGLIYALGPKPRNNDDLVP